MPCGLRCGVSRSPLQRSARCAAAARRATLRPDEGAPIEITTSSAPSGAGRSAGVDLYWLPLGARGHVVRLGGRLYEAAAALAAGRTSRPLYHSVLEVTVPDGRFVIEMAPALAAGESRGVVAHGSVATRRAGRFRHLRYEVRCWKDGVTAYAYAVESPVHLTGDNGPARRLLELVRTVPAHVWGRDEVGAGEMWTCNSLTSWLLGRTGLWSDAIRPPGDGRAPGWHAGLVAAERSA